MSEKRARELEAEIEARDVMIAELKAALAAKATPPPTEDNTPSVHLPTRPDGTPYRYHAFLSHASVDKPHVRNLQRRLEAEGFQAWMDETHIPWGKSIRWAITEGLADSRHVVLFLSRAALASEWKEFEELVATLSDPANRDRRLLPLLLDDVDVPPHIGAFRYLPYRTKEERDLAWWWISTTLSGTSATGAPRAGPTVMSRDERRSLIGRYRALLHKQHHRFRILGLGVDLSLSFVLAQTWVSLQARVHRSVFRGRDFGSAAALHAELGCEAPDEGVYPLEAAFKVAEEEYGRPQGIVVVGDPGSGKTTLLRQLLMLCLERGSESLGLPPDLLPVHLPLRDLQPSDQTFADFLQRRLGLNKHLGDLDQVGADLQKRGELLLLLDGLDEVSDRSRRAQVRQWIKDAAECPDYYLAVTTRYAGWRSGELGDEFVEFHILPFSEGQAQQFIANWFRGVLQAERGLKEAVRLEAETQAAELWDQLQAHRAGSRRLRAMTTNPLLLSILCLIQYQNNSLPRERQALYQQATEVLVHHWRAALGIPSRFDLATTQARLEPVAWEMTTAGETVIDEDRLAGWLSQPNPGRRTEPLTDREARAFLHGIRDESGLLVGWGEDRYGFLHKTFQEYLTAREVVRRGGLAELAHHFPDQPVRSDDEERWWEEVILLALALDPPDAPQFAGFFGALIESGRILGDPNLVGEALEEAANPNPGPFLAAVRGEGQASPQSRGRALALLKGRFEGDEAVTTTLQRAWTSPPTWMAALGHTERQTTRQTLSALLQERGVAAAPTATLRGEREAGTVHVIQLGGVDLELVWVPPGWFMMGASDLGEEFPESLRKTASPPHRVTLTQGFWLGRYPVTNAQYMAFVKAKGAPEPKHFSDRPLNAPDQPVVYVSWEDVGAFCEWASVEVGECVRRPTEAEWEYAARGPGERPSTYPWGEAAPSAELANFDGAGVGRTSPVGSYPKGAAWCGALDMAGNVLEWCEDRRGTYPSSPQTDPLGPTHGSPRVLRGGSWVGDAWGLRGAYRRGVRPAGRDAIVGFRVVVAGGSVPGAGVRSPRGRRPSPPGTG